MTNPTMPTSAPVPDNVPVGPTAQSTQSNQQNKQNQTNNSDHPAVVRRSVPVGAPNKSANSLELITDANGNVQAIEVICSCGERHLIHCEYEESS